MCMCLLQLQIWSLGAALGGCVHGRSGRPGSDQSHHPSVHSHQQHLHLQRHEAVVNHSTDVITWHTHRSHCEMCCEMLREWVDDGICQCVLVELGSWHGMHVRVMLQLYNMSFVALVQYCIYVNLRIEVCINKDMYCASIKLLELLYGRILVVRKFKFKCTLAPTNALWWD